MALVRIRNEFKKFAATPPEGMSLNAEKSSVDQYIWYINLSAAEGTIYEGEQYELRVKFTEDYPFTAPQVVFSSAVVPCNPHVYSNGHICISILGNDWRPALDIQSVCLSILSMLSSCERKAWPEGDTEYSRTMGNRSPDYRFFNGTYSDTKC